MIDHLVKDFDENIKSLQNFFDLLSLFLDEHHKNQMLIILKHSSLVVSISFLCHVSLCNYLFRLFFFTFSSISV